MAVTDLEKIIPDFAKDRSGKTNIALGVISGVLAVTVIALISIIATSNSGVSQPEAPATVEGLMAGAYMMSNMDQSVDPCDDFYRYACGGWERMHSIPPDQTSVSVEGQLRAQHDESLREALEAPTRNSQISATERKLKSFFASCLHDYGRSKDAGVPLIEAINEHLKGWYVLNPTGWNVNWDVNAAWSAMLGPLMVPCLISYTIIYDNISPNDNTLEVFPGGFGADNGHYSFFDPDFPEELIDDYKVFMRSTTELLIRDSKVSMSDADKNQRVDQFMNDVWTMEMTLANFSSWAMMDSGYYNAKRTTLGQLQSQFDKIRFVDVFAGIFTDIQVGGDMQVSVLVEKYFQYLNEFLKTTGTDQDRMLNNYMVWRLTMTYARDLSADYVQVARTFMERWRGVTEYPATWTSCMNTMKWTFHEGMAAEYARTHLGESAKEKADEVYKYVQKALIDRIASLPWMDDVTRARAQEKVAHVSDLIGFPDYILDEAAMDDLYSVWEVNETAGYFRNLLKANDFLRFDMGRRIKEGGTTDRWITEALTVAIFYDSYFNELMVTPGIKRGPIFYAKAPAFLNFGGLGSAIGNEIVYSVGRLGRYGWWNHTRWQWWSNYTLYNYNSQEECMTQYYDGIMAGPYLVNGENQTIAIKGKYHGWTAAHDTASYRLALKAYLAYEKDKGKVSSLPGLTFDNKKALFLASVQRQCFRRRDETSYLLVRTLQVPENIRVNGALAHLPEFAETFGCRAGSKMRADEQCTVF